MLRQQLERPPHQVVPGCSDVDRLAGLGVTDVERATDRSHRHAATVDHRSMAADLLMQLQLVDQVQRHHLGVDEVHAVDGKPGDPKGSGELRRRGQH